MPACNCTVDRMCDECWDKMVDYLDEISAGNATVDEEPEDVIEALVDNATVTLTVSEFREKLSEAAEAAREEEQLRSWKAVRQSVLNMDRERIYASIMMLFEDMDSIVEFSTLLKSIENIINDKES